MSLVAIFIVTYRRHDMLKRALASVKNQTLSDFNAFVVNDDPLDDEVERIVNALGDDRFHLFRPISRRGAAHNFNLMFGNVDATYVSLLEDDNWWQPEFLETMVDLLQSNIHCEAACCNERIWKETPAGEWIDTGENIWPDFGMLRFEFDVEHICGSAILCNSAMLYRLLPTSRLLTPNEIPVDVTEHFRERLLTGELVLCSVALVNYAETLTTARGDRQIWGDYQALLIGSVFAALTSLDSRLALSRLLWARALNPISPRAVTLLLTGLSIQEARALAFTAPLMAWCRVFLMIIWRPRYFIGALSVQIRLADHFLFLRNAPVTCRVAASFEETLS